MNTPDNKTEQAILQAFKDLVLSERYDDIRVGDIVRDSDVGRSTFYDHFQDKDDVLLTSMKGIFHILAAALDAPPPLAAISFILQHFVDHQQQSRQMLNSPTQKTIVKGLACVFATKLEGDTTLPRELIALQLADATLSLVRHWLSTDLFIDSGQVAQALCHSLRAIRHAHSK